MDAPAIIVAVLIPAFAAGATLGAVHFGSLWWSIVLLREGRTLAGIAAQALRFVALAAALALIARQGAAPLLAAALGVLAARGFLMRRHRRLG